ncbi:MAG: hypothetical protein IPK52_09815 [Chloroflexi bacterium]|nr:hypothetical protein [Chloroflexota bacterium]
MRPNTVAAAILGLFVVLALGVAAAVPLFEASDEAAHFLYAHGLVSTGVLPNIPTRDDLDDAAARGDVVAQWSIESHQPPLYYALGALLISPTTRSDIADYLRSNDLIFTWGRRDGNSNQWLHSPAQPSGDTHVAIWTLRLFSLTLACGTLWCIFRAAFLATGSTPFALTVMLTTACIPTFAAISASVNNDNLVTMLCSAAIYWTLRVLRFGLRKYDWAVIAFIVSAIALTKFTGIWVVAVVALGLWLALRDGKITRQDALIVVGAIAIGTVFNAGWWYARNWELYGDPLAVQATQALWGRTFAVASESGGLVAEIPRIWQSFWLMIGHLHEPVWGPAWFYVAAVVLCVLAGVGWISFTLYLASLPQETASAKNATIWILVFAALLPVGMLIYGTRMVDISYGRLLFPGLVGIVPLLVLGWSRLFGRFMTILTVPLVIVTAVMPYTVIRPAYPTLEQVDALPETAIPLNIRVADSTLTVLGYEPMPRTIAQGFGQLPDAAPPLTLYLTGNDPRNPALTVAWLSARLGQNLGQVTMYPGMAPTDALSDSIIYRATIPTAPLLSTCVYDSFAFQNCDIRTGRIRLELKWQTDGSTILNTTGTDEQNRSILLPGPTFGDDLLASYTVSNNRIAASFGGIVELYTPLVMSEYVLLPNDAHVNLVWDILAAPPSDLTLTVQIFNSEGAFVANADGDIDGYPAEAWVEGAVTDERIISLPDDLAPGTYTVAVGWYTRDDLARLPVTAEAVRDNLAIIGTFEVLP